ncbi:MAG: hypothetical protein ACK5QT_00735 [Oligoflexia bacterium]
MGSFVRTSRPGPRPSTHLNRFYAVFAIFAPLSFSISAFASLPGDPLKQIHSLNVHSGGSPKSNATFDSLIKLWKGTPSQERSARLEQIALDSSHSERTRYIALMGAWASKPRGQPLSLKTLKTLQSDASWVLRIGVLKSLNQLKPDQARSPEVQSIALGLLKDKALVVRTEAVETVLKLNPPGASEALLAAALDPGNYAGGKGLWVPQRALRALQLLNKERPNPKLTQKLQSLVLQKKLN